MYYNLLNSIEKKNFLLILTHVVSISDGEDEDGIDQESDSVGDVGRFIVRSISRVYEMDMMEKNDELNKEKNRISSSELAYIRSIYSSLLFDKDGYISSRLVTLLKAWQEEELEPLLKKWLVKARKEVAKSSDAKRLVMLSLAESDFDITAIKEKDVEREIMRLPETRKRVFSEAAIYAVDELLPSDLTVNDRKAILFDLMAMAYADGDLSEIELETVKSVSQAFGIDDESFIKVCAISEKSNDARALSLQLISGEGID